MIKTIIFDNNGVITNHGKEGGHQRVADFLGQDFDIFYPVWSKFAESVDLGEITTEEFYEKILEEFNIERDLEEFSRLHHGCYDVKDEMHQFVKDLSKGYEIALLSNFGDRFDDFNKTWQLDSLFVPEKMFVSHKLKMKKPESEIYNYALDNLNRKPEETVFIDDREENVIAASNLGMNAILFESKEQLERDLGNYIEIKTHV